MYGGLGAFRDSVLIVEPWPAPAGSQRMRTGTEISGLHSARTLQGLSSGFHNLGNRVFRD